VGQNYSKAKEWYEKAAKQGNLSAQNNLGAMYFQGHGVEQSHSTAVEWYKNAAENGLARAQYNLGAVYENGRGDVEKNYELAVKWYMKAAHQGHARSQGGLGHMYFGGRGVRKNYKTATMWWEKAAEQGHTSSQLTMCRMYRDGLGVGQSPSTALMWSRRVLSSSSVDRNSRTTAHILERQCQAYLFVESRLGLAIGSFLYGAFIAVVAITIKLFIWNDRSSGDSPVATDDKWLLLLAWEIFWRWKLTRAVWVLFSYHSILFLCTAAILLTFIFMPIERIPRLRRPRWFQTVNR
jgi:hypothetical protein